MTIPAHIDHQSILADLNRWGWFDSRIEIMCGYSQAYVARLKAHADAKMSYDRAARLYNLWCDEHDKQRAETRA